MALSTDFKDDVLASSNSKRKYNMIHNPDGTVSFEDVTVYSQEGSDFGAKEVNEERAEINKHTTLLGDTDISDIEDGTVTGAIAGLNENLTNKIQYHEIQVEIGNGNNLPGGGFSSGAVDVSNEFPSAKKVVAIGGRRSGTQYVCNATIENNTTMYCNAVSAGVYYVTIIGFY